MNFWILQSLQILRKNSRQLWHLNLHLQLFYIVLSNIFPCLKYSIGILNQSIKLNRRIYHSNSDLIHTLEFKVWGIISTFVWQYVKIKMVYLKNGYLYFVVLLSLYSTLCLIFKCYSKLCCASVQNTTNLFITQPEELYVSTCIEPIETYTKQKSTVMLIKQCVIVSSV